MNTLHFKYALEVEKTGSITQAADNLYMGQPSLSKAIKELEDTLRIEIFKRSSRGMVPTREGAQFLQYARNVLMQLDKMEQISARNEARRDSLHISLPQSAYLAEGTRAFCGEILKDHAQDLHFYTLCEKEVFRRFNDGSLQLAVLRIPASLFPLYKEYCDTRNLELEGLWEFEETLLTSEKTVFSPGKILPRDALVQFTPVALPKEEPLFSAAASGDPASLSEKIPDGGQVSFSHYGEALSFLSENSSSYLLWEPLTQEQLASYRLCAFSIKDGLRYQDLLLYPEDYSFKKAERLFIDKLYEKRNQLTF